MQPIYNANSDARQHQATSKSTVICSKQPLACLPKNHLDKIRQDAKSLKPYLVKYLHAIAKSRCLFAPLISNENPGNSILRRGLCNEASAILQFLLESKGHLFEVHESVLWNHTLLASVFQGKRVIIDPTYLQYFKPKAQGHLNPQICMELDNLFFTNEILVVPEGNFDDAARQISRMLNPPWENIRRIFGKFASTLHTQYSNAESQKAIIKSRYPYYGASLDSSNSLFLKYNIDRGYSIQTNRLSQYLMLGSQGKFDFMPEYALAVVKLMREDGFLKRPDM
ncbi:hypothetical protein FJZ26_02390 [Candidatus Parvarchaeota archaeon]|nr:hypothetical protein [Candidatus Parvarchaeota archaeon]